MVYCCCSGTGNWGREGAHWEGEIALLHDGVVGVVLLGVVGLVKAKQVDVSHLHSAVDGEVTPSNMNE